MAAEEKNPPGQEWREILSRPTLAEFARAFAAEPVLHVSVLADPIVGVAGIRASPPNTARACGPALRGRASTALACVPPLGA